MAGESAAPTTQTAPTADSQQAPQHHINRQPRDFAGRVNGAPTPQQGGQRPPAPDAPQAPPPKVKVKYKVDGADIEEELDHDTLGNRLSRERAAYSKFEEAAKMRKEAAKIQKDFQEGLSSPGQFRKRMTENLVAQGMDPKEARNRVHDTLALALADVLEEDELSPEQRELRELRARDKERQDAEQEQERTRQQEAFSGRVRQRAQAFQEAIGQAFQSAQRGGLPVNERTLAVMGEHYLANLANGVGCTPEELVQVYESELDQLGGQRLEALGYEALKKRYPGLVRAIHQGLREEAASRKGKPPPQVTRGTPRPSEKQPQGKAPVTSDDFEGYRARHRVD